MNKEIIIDNILDKMVKKNGLELITHDEIMWLIAQYYKYQDLINRYATTVGKFCDIIDNRINKK